MKTSDGKRLKSLGLLAIIASVGSRALWKSGAKPREPDDNFCV